MTNDVSLNIPSGEKLTVGKLREYLDSANRIDLSDDTAVTCLADNKTGKIFSLQSRTPMPRS